MIKSNFDGMVVIESNGAVLFANPAAERLLGRVLSQLVYINDSNGDVVRTPIRKSREPRSGGAAVLESAHGSSRPRAVPGFR